jgi:hypothetical protein
LGFSFRDSKDAGQSASAVHPDDATSLEVAAGILLARVEASAPSVGKMTEEEKLNKALILAIQDKSVSVEVTKFDLK